MKVGYKSSESMPHHELMEQKPNMNHVYKVSGRADDEIYDMRRNRQVLYRLVVYKLKTNETNSY